MQNKIKQLKEMLNHSSNVAIFTHMNCDGDALGSAMAVREVLLSMNKTVSLFVQKPIHTNYNYLDIKGVVNKRNSKTFDLCISVDCPNIKRFGKYGNLFKKYHSVCFDHHLLNENFAELNFIDEKASSTCELLYEIFKNLNFNITSKIATYLYTGIATDTGRFSHNNTTEKSLRYASELAGLGADLKGINYNMFEKKSINEFSLFINSLSNIKFYSENKIAFVGITRKMLDEVGASEADTYRIVDFICGIDTVEVAVLMTELTERESMVSVRTKNVSAQEICKSFGGGGHKHASGCRIFTDFESAKVKLIERCEQEVR